MSDFSNCDNKYKLIVFDLDDTIAVTGESILKQDVEILKDIEKTGIKIAVCSGKPVYYLCGFMRQTGINNAILIGENGAVIQFGISLPPKKFLFLPYPDCADYEIDFLRKEFNKLIPDLWYQPNQVGLTPFPKNEKEFSILQRCLDDNKEKIKNLTIYRHADSFDITPFGITKYTGLEFLGKQINVRANETIAVGDGVNDYPMFEYAGYSIGVHVKNPNAVCENFDNANEALQHALKLISNKKN